MATCHVLLRRVVCALDHPDPPSPILTSGRVTVEAWVEGVSLAHRCTVGHVEAAADLLGRLHACARRCPVIGSNASAPSTRC